MTNHQDLKELLVGFDDFLNSPPAGEDARRVRDYRHEAYAKWSPVASGFSTLLDEREALLGENRALQERVDYLTAPEVREAIDTAEAAVRRLDEKLTDSEAQAADLVGEVERLRAALEQGAQWFDEYAEMHLAKPDYDKAARNTSRAEYLRSVSSIKEKSCG